MNQNRYPKLETKKLIALEHTDLHKKVVCYGDVEVRGKFKVKGIDSNIEEACLRTTGTKAEMVGIRACLEAVDGAHQFLPEKWGFDDGTGTERAYSIGSIRANPNTFTIHIGKDGAGLYEFTVNGTIRIASNVRMSIVKNPTAPAPAGGTVLPEYHTFDESWQQVTLITCDTAARDDIYALTFEVDATSEVSVFSLIFKARKIK